MAAFTGYHPEVGVGHIDSGLTFSPVQLLLDMEFTKGLKFLENPEISSETMGLESIINLGFNLSENFAATDHTLQYMRSDSWNPQLICRNGWDMTAEKVALDNAQKLIKEYIAAYKKPQEHVDKLHRGREVIEKARRELSSHH